MIEDPSDIKEIVSKIIQGAKKQEINLSEYDELKRTDDLWVIATKLIQQKQAKLDNLLKLCSPLLDPLSIVYSQLPTAWAHNLKRYEISTRKDMKTGKEQQETTGPTSFLEGAHAPVVIQGGKQYHIYCYDLVAKFKLYGNSAVK
jgi:hypothetical protein